MGNRRVPGEYGNERRVMNRFLQVTLFYGAFLFLYFFTEYAAVNRALLLFKPEQARLLYALSMLSSAAGYAVFGLLGRYVRAYRKRRTVLFAMALAYLAAVVPLVLDIGGGAGRWALSLLAMFSCSYIGGAAHYYASYALCGAAYSGRAVGTALALATLGQSALAAVHDHHVLAAVVACGGVAALSLILLNPTRYWRMADVVVPRAQVEIRTERKSPPMLLLCGIFALIVLTASIGNCTLTALYTESALRFTLLPRFAFAATALLAGVLADLKNRLVLPVHLLSVILLSLLGYLFLFWKEWHVVHAVLLYEFSGTYVLCATLAFLELAPDTRCPHQWAGMGQLLRAFMLGATGLLLNEPVSALAQANALPKLQLFAVLPALAALWLAVLWRSRLPERIWPSGTVTASAGAAAACGSASARSGAALPERPDAAGHTTANAGTTARDKDTATVGTTIPDKDAATVGAAARDKDTATVGTTVPDSTAATVGAATPDKAAATVGAAARDKDTATVGTTIPDKDAATVGAAIPGNTAADGAAATPADVAACGEPADPQTPEPANNPAAGGLLDADGNPKDPVLAAFVRQYDLTKREIEVLAAVLEGDGTIRMLASEVCMSERMVYRHLSAIYEKTGTNSRATLVRMYYRQEWRDRSR